MGKSNQFASYPSLGEKVVLVTGGASGIGEAIVEAFAMQRSQVVFLDIQQDIAEAVVRRLLKAGVVEPSFYPCDLRDIPSLQRTVEAIIETFGRVDVLVNNAGNDTRHSIEEVTSESWDELMAVNLKHQFFVTQNVIPGMRRGRWLDYQYEFHRLGYSVDGIACVCNSQGGNRGDDAYASPRAWRR